MLLICVQLRHPKQTAIWKVVPRHHKCDVSERYHKDCEATDDPKDYCFHFAPTSSSFPRVTCTFVHKLTELQLE